MKSEKFKPILSCITESLLCDIKAGLGHDLMPIPQTEDPQLKEVFEELSKFWQGKTEVSKYDLFSSILAFCDDTDSMLIPTLTQVILAKYPETEAKLTVNSIADIVTQLYADNIPAPVRKSNVQQDEAHVVAVAAVPPIAKQPVSSNKRNNSQYNEMIESKKALIAERDNK